MTDLVRRLLAGEPALRFVLVERDGSLRSEGDLGGAALLPGSFNPLHEGHRRLAAAASAQLGREVVFELSAINVDKPPLAEADVRARLAQFAGRARVALTRAPRFVEKARLFAGCTFVAGWDTAKRLIDARYYGGEPAMHAALDEMRSLGCRFLVGGRMVDGIFRTLSASDVPQQFASLFEAIPEDRFRVDVTSTELRGGR